MDSNELYHYGVLGMKWGVRRAQNRVSRIGKKAKRGNWSDDAKSAAEIKTKNVKQMSNAELRKLNERTRLENEYKNLNKRKVSSGEKFVTEVIKDSSKEIAKDYTKKYMRKGIKIARMILRAR